MAGRVLTHRDAHALINAINAEMQGTRSTIQAVDTSTFISVGETILSNPMENVYNAIAIVLGRFMVQARPYAGKFASIRAINSGIYSNRLRAVSFYSKAALGDGSTNNQITTNLATGYDNGKNNGQSEASQWEQHPAMPLELGFGGSSTWQDCITRYENQVQLAFASEDDFITFVNGYVTEKMNDITQQKEAFDRAAVLNFIAGIVDMGADMPGSSLNLTAAFNAAYGTSYTTAELLSDYQAQFYPFFVATVKNVVNEFENRDAKYHWSVPKTVGNDTYHILRHTPKSNAKMMLLDRFWINAEAQVKSAIFNPSYLDFGRFESILYWQNANEPAKIDVTPAIPDKTNLAEQKAGARVQLSNVLGLIYDEDAIITDYQLDDVSTTNKEARKHYRNTWYTMRRNAINNFTQKAVLLYMAD